MKCQLLIVAPNVRSHLCGTDEAKVKVVWGYPATITFGEAVFAIPLTREYQRRKNSYCLWIRIWCRRKTEDFSKFPWDPFRQHQF